MGGPVTGLVLPGGGARGAYQVGVVKALAEMAPRRGNPFPVISGVSAGAINAASLASRAERFTMAARRLERLWRNLHCGDVFETSSLKVMASGAHWLLTFALGGLGIGGNPRSLLDNRPLGRLLAANLDPDGIERAIAVGALKAFGVTAAGYTSGHAITFFEAADGAPEWERVRREGLRRRVQVDHVMASAALPFVFPAVKLGPEYFGDGSLRLTAPLSPAIRMGADRLLVVGVRDRTPIAPAPESAPLTHPSLGDLGGYALDILFSDNLDADQDRLTRINQTLGLLPEDRRDESGFRHIELLIIDPSRDLREIAAAHAHEMPPSIRVLLKGLGSWGRDSRLLSYLLFEPGFIGALIDLGYADAMARRGECEAFLSAG